MKSFVTKECFALAIGLYTSIQMYTSEVSDVSLQEHWYNHLGENVQINAWLQIIKLCNI